MEKKCLLHTLSEITAKFLIRLLGNCWQKVENWGKSPIEKESVYDLINVEKSNRFLCANGVIYHNCLALQYGMGAISLANELTQKLKEPYTEAKAQRLIDLFNRSYRTHYRWKDRILYEYKRDGFMKLPCGWYMWGDNENLRSVNNVPVQGFGSSIMRKAVTMAQDAGLDVILTLHDAIYVEYHVCDYDAIDELARAMKLAFKHYFKGEMRERANVGLDISTWSLEYSNEVIETHEGYKVKQQTHYMDPRGKNEYEKFSKYFVNQGIDL